MSSSSPLSEPTRYSEDIDSACSTPFVSAPSSPGHIGAPPSSGYFFSAPASPMHFLLLSSNDNTAASEYNPTTSSFEFEFEFSSRSFLKESGPAMTSADELFFNGQIRPMKLSSHLEVCSDLEDEAVEMAARGRDQRVAKGHAHHRKARSMSPMRAYKPDEWHSIRDDKNRANDVVEGAKENESSTETTPSSSRSSSSGRNSKKWIFLKDLLHRSKSEGRAVANNNKERFWSAISFEKKKMKKKKSASSSSPTSLSPSSSRDEKKSSHSVSEEAVKKKVAGKPANGVWRRRKLSAHEIHYTANRAQAEEMKKKTFLPYRQGLLGCLGFSSKSYGVFSGFTKNLSPISSR